MINRQHPSISPNRTPLSGSEICPCQSCWSGKIILQSKGKLFHCPPTKKKSSSVACPVELFRPTTPTPPPPTLSHQHQQTNTKTAQKQAPTEAGSEEFRYGSFPFLLGFPLRLTGCLLLLGRTLPKSEWGWEGEATERQPVAVPGLTGKFCTLLVVFIMWRKLCWRWPLECQHLEEWNQIFINYCDSNWKKMKII